MKIGIAVLLMTITSSSFATVGTSHVYGEVYDVTSVPSGLLIRVKDDQQTDIVPTDCQNTIYGWMLIPEANKTMIAVALAMRAQGKKSATVYVSPTTNGYCNVTQYDPHDNI